MLCNLWIFYYLFHQFEAEMIAKLDSLVEGGHADHNFKELFNIILTNLCEKHATMSTQVYKLQINALSPPLKLWFQGETLRRNDDQTDGVPTRVPQRCH